MGAIMDVWIGLVSEWMWMDGWVDGIWMTMKVDRGMDA